MKIKRVSTDYESKSIRFNKRIDFIQKVSHVLAMVIACIGVLMLIETNNSTVEPISDVISYWIEGVCCLVAAIVLWCM